jgi:uncharacterized protein
MFTPVETTVGALLLQQATSNLLYQNGNILGASGFLRRLLSEPTRELLSFFVGMASSFIPVKAFVPHLLTHYPPVSMTLQTGLVTLGTAALIGWGTKVSGISGVVSTTTTRLTVGRCQMAVPQGICYVVCPD